MEEEMTDLCQKMTSRYIHLSVLMDRLKDLNMYDPNDIEEYLHTLEDFESIVKQLNSDTISMERMKNISLIL